PSGSSCASPTNSSISVIPLTILSSSTASPTPTITPAATTTNSLSFGSAFKLINPEYAHGSENISNYVTNVTNVANIAQNVSNVSNNFKNPNVVISNNIDHNSTKPVTASNEVKTTIERDEICCDEIQ